MSSSRYVLYPDEDKRFPNLKGTGFKVTSQKANEYNCIAWAVGDKNRWWWPDQTAGGFWPSGIEPEDSVSSFIVLFESQGFICCTSPSLEPGVEKVAIYSDDMGVTTHAARQLPNGKWTSKLGPEEDIEHSLEGLEGPEYGTVDQILSRQLVAFARWVHIITVIAAKVSQFT